jgi:hypothetical protein
MKYSSLHLILTLVIASILLWGCATIMHGTSQKIGISSLPTGAKVSVDNLQLGDTPLFANLKRGDDHIVTIEMEGFQKVQLTITKSVSGWVWGNIVFGGLIGLVVDAVSGGLYNLSPEQLHAELKKQNIGATIKNDGVYLLTVLHPDPSWQKISVLKSEK